MSEDALKRLRCVLDEIGENPSRIFFVYGLYSLHTGVTAFRDLNRYSLTELKRDVKTTLLKKFPNLNMKNLWDEMNDIFNKCQFKWENDIWYNFREEIYNRFQEKIDEFILQKINSLTLSEKIVIKEFLLDPPDQSFYLTEWGGFSKNEGETYEWRKRFEMKLNNHNIGAIDYRELLVSVGLLYKSVWKTTNVGQINNGIMYDFPNYFESFKSRTLWVEEPSIRFTN